MRTKKTSRKNSMVQGGRGATVGKAARSFFLVILPVAVAAATVYLAAHAALGALRIERIVMKGNEHLTDDELRNLADVRMHENLLLLSGRKVLEKMQRSPWVREASVRKEFPDELQIRILEAEPFALLDHNSRLFLIDERGRMLEDLKDSQMPFLPVISSDPLREREAFTEAVALVSAIRADERLTRKDHIEVIAHRPVDISMNLDGLLVKIGAGEYREKLSRLAEIEEEILRRSIPVDYVDLRFANKVVVKPVNEVVQ